MIHGMRLVDLRRCHHLLLSHLAKVKRGGSIDQNLIVAGQHLVRRHILLTLLVHLQPRDLHLWRALVYVISTITTVDVGDGLGLV